MKFSVKLIAAALCAAVLCVPALAAASATGAGAYVPNPQYTVISGTVAHQKDGGLLMSTSTGEPTEDYILWTEGVAILDAVSGEPVDAKSIKDGSTVYAWLGAQTAMTMSLPPQVTPELLLVNVPADYKVPQYDVIVRSDGLTGLGIPQPERYVRYPVQRDGVSGVAGRAGEALSYPQPGDVSGSAARYPRSGVGR